MSPMVRRLWCWLFHEKIAGLCLGCLHLKPIRGGQDDMFGFASDLGGYPGPSIPDFQPGPSVDVAPPTNLAEFASGIGAGAPPAASPPTDVALGAYPGPSQPTPAPQPSGLNRFATGLTNEVTSNPLSAFAKLLGVGATGLGIANQFSVGRQAGQQTKVLTQAEKAAQTAAAPAVEFGTEQLKSAQAGQLPAPMEAAVQQWTQQAKAAIRAQYAQMGLGNSSDIATAEANIDLMGEAMKGQLLQSQEQIGLQGIGQGVSAATGTAQIAAQQQQLLTNLIAAANQQLGSLAAKSA